MAYCRWSCDNMRSDVYVYEADDDFIRVDIRNWRYVVDESFPLVPEFNSTNAAEVYVAMQKQSSYLRHCEREKLTLEHAGKSFFFEDLLSTKLFLRQLQDIGYHVPQHAFDRIDEDISKGETQ